MESLHFPQDWLNAYSHEDSQIDTFTYQDEFEDAVMTLIEELDLDLSKHIDSKRHKLKYEDDRIQLLAFALFGCSIGAFELSDWIKGLDDIDMKIQKMTYHNDDLVKTQKENPTLAHIVSMAEMIHNVISSEECMLENE